MDGFKPSKDLLFRIPDPLRAQDFGTLEAGAGVLPSRIPWMPYP